MATAQVVFIHLSASASLPPACAKEGFEFILLSPRGDDPGGKEAALAQLTCYVGAPSASKPAKGSLLGPCYDWLQTIDALGACCVEHLVIAEDGLGAFHPAS
ncbi:hypothetical protein H920_17493 [Fukomys damarensis]|uniref:Uncharacterized protein n=1 Tax=Fukomys damarensis TaxID=885580 RepID=A0A091CU73_FUKDA|nr:hypothetical protein H920_17493 [Fukomys damarensis]